MAKLDDVVVGTEVDYNPVGSVWVPARVETAGETTVRLRFACALRDVVHEVSIETLVKEKRIGPAGMRSVPLLNGQPIDVLRRAQGGVTLGACEQWQQGEVVTSTGKLTSYGGDRPVTVRVTSAGEAVLGVTYPPPHVPGLAPPTPAIVLPASSSSSSALSSTEAASVAGGGSSSEAGRSSAQRAAADPSPALPAASTSTSTASAKPPLHGSGPPLPPAQSPTPAILLAEPYLLAPRSTFAVRVPTLAHITPVQPAGGSSGAATPAPAVRSLDKRAKSLLADCAVVTARLHLCGRAGLPDYCLLDILPPDTAPFSTRSSSAAAAGAADPPSPYVAGGPVTGGGPHHHVWYASDPLETALRAAYGVGLGHVSGGARGRSASDAATQEQLEQAVTGLSREGSTRSIGGRSRSRSGNSQAPGEGSTAGREQAHSRGAAGDTLVLPYSRAFAFYGESGSRGMGGSGTKSAPQQNSTASTWKSSSGTGSKQQQAQAAAGGAEPGLAGHGHLPARLSTRPWRLARLHWEPLTPSSAGQSTGGGVATRARTGSGSLGVGLSLGLGLGSVTSAGAPDRAVVADFATEGKKGSSSAATASAAGSHAASSSSSSSAHAHDSGSSSSSVGNAGTNGTGAGGVTHRPIVHWFEPLWVTAEDGTTRKLVPILRAAPLEDMLACAAPGTHTVPFVPGQRVESRRLGGLWAPSRVEWADRGLIAISVMRPALRSGAAAPSAASALKNGASASSAGPAGGAVVDSNATAPSALAFFGRHARPMVVKKKRRRKGAGAGPGGAQAAPPLSRDRSSSFVPISGALVGGGRASAPHGHRVSAGAGPRSALERWSIVRSRLQGVPVSGRRLSRWGSSWGVSLLAPFLQPHSRHITGQAGKDQHPQQQQQNGKHSSSSSSSSTGLVDSVEFLPQHMWSHLVACRGQYVGEEGWKAFDTLFRQQRMRRVQAGGGGGAGAAAAVSTAAAALLVELSCGRGAAVSQACASVHEDLQAKQGALMRLVRPE